MSFTRRLYPSKQLLQSIRRYSTEHPSKLRIGYVPEHFSTPLFFAQKHFNLDAELIPFQSGTGHMVESLKSSELDVGVGLTEGWIAGMGRTETAGAFKMIGTYVESPLCWAINISPSSETLETKSDLAGMIMGISRFGSGSHIMGFVFAEEMRWLSPFAGMPFTPYPLNNFALLRKAVQTGYVDFFLWENFTCRKYHQMGEIRRIGEVYSPWSSWKIVARDTKDQRLGPALDCISKGIVYFDEHHDEAVEHINTTMDYSAEDAREWLKTVKFAKDVRRVDHVTVGKAIAMLRRANVLNVKAGPHEMIAAVD